MAANKFRVIILKAPSEEGVEQDAYVQLLNSSGFSAIMIPTLEFRYKNLDLLSDCLRRPHEYSGDEKIHEHPPSMFELSGKTFHYTSQESLLIVQDVPEPLLSVSKSYLTWNY